eukprot:5633784-Pyramimonas_sp.AAC.1
MASCSGISYIVSAAADKRHVSRLFFMVSWPFGTQASSTCVNTEAVPMRSASKNALWLAEDSLQGSLDHEGL